MADRSTKNHSDVWRLDSDKATLTAAQLAASVDLHNPQAGLSFLTFLGKPITGCALGMNANAQSSKSKLELCDAFVRGDDLVATYEATNEQPFSLQVYWRVTLGEHGAVLLDSIVSLQTALLESFPGIAIETKLPIANAWMLPDDGTAAAEITFPCNRSADQSEGLLLRLTNDDWSYAEVTHSTDRGECTIKRCQDESLLIRRQLGGQFLEKGVIRSIRVRGVFLPRENDLERAAQYFAAFKTAELPLTV